MDFQQYIPRIVKAVIFTLLTGVMWAFTLHFGFENNNYSWLIAVFWTSFIAQLEGKNGCFWDE